MAESNGVLRTSCIDFVSSVHGEQRRRERDIDKRDLQAAIKYGSKEMTFCRSGHQKGDLRWKYTFAEVVYITDKTSTNEITSWTFPLPLQKAPLDSKMIRQINEQKNRLAISPITSHTILIVDQSASMNSSDVSGHRSRSRGVFYNIANEIIAAPLLANQKSYTDVVTLIEMRDEATINPLICRAPIDWDTYNKFVDLADDELRGKSHGNYLPALELLWSYLLESNEENCALLVFFLSDGKPSDHINSTKAYNEIYMQTYINCICSKFGSRLTFGFMGFANKSCDFSVLKKLSNQAESAGAKVSFFAEGVLCGSLRGLLSTLVTSLTDTRSSLSSILPNTRSSTIEIRRPGMIKDLSPLQSNSDTVFNKDEWNFYGENDCIKRVKPISSKNRRTTFWDQIPPISKAAEGIAVKKEYLDKGSERIVFKMTEEVDKDNMPVGEPLVVKINPFVEEDSCHQLVFHEIFGRTQREASRFAAKFNERLDFLKVPIDIPRIKFLDCTYYTMRANDCEAGFLVEKRLDNTKFKKWSDNKGGVHNLPRGAMALGSSQEILATIDEEDEEGSVDSCFSDTRQALMDSILDDDIPQAFSHYSYVYSKHDRLVCDIQGVLHHNPPLFELTDPAIHSEEKGQFGKTDFGGKGMQEFFKTHECNPLCKVLFPNTRRYL
jgi:hypothetical protein